MLNIDKKNVVLNFDKDKDQRDFDATLKQLYPQLSSQEIRLCTYFRLNLGSKEISMIEGSITPGSVRVYKNKIKNKIGLTAEDNLNDFLRAIN